MAEAQDYRQIGSRPIRPDGVDKVTGRAQFGADQNLPGMLYGAILRSPHAHARIKSIDLSGAKSQPGVLAAVQGSDFPAVDSEAIVGGEGAGNFADLAVNVMARDKVLYHGHAVAAVAATSQAAANAALAQIKVEYEKLTPVMSIDQAMADGAPLVREGLLTAGLAEPATTPSNVAARMEFARGDLDAGFAAADVIIEGEYATPTVHQGYIEPHACTVRTNEDGQVVIWCCTQGHFDVRSLSAKVLGLNVADIKVIASEIGGGFGGKTTVYLEPVAIKLSQQAGRPVKMIMTRDEVFRASGPASATKSTVKIGATRDGKITAAQVSMAFEAGAYPGSSFGPGSMCALAAYDLENFQIEGFDVLVNKPKVAAYRAPGAPQAMYATECALDELAR